MATISGLTPQNEKWLDTAEESTQDYVRQAARFRAQVMTPYGVPDRHGEMGGGATYSPEDEDIVAGKPNQPTTGYAVAGMLDYRREGAPRVPERVLNAAQFTPVAAMNHILDVQEHAADRAGRGKVAPRVGGWTEGDSYVLDHTAVVPSLAEAHRQAVGFIYRRVCGEGEGRLACSGRSDTE